MLTAVAAWSATVVCAFQTTVPELQVRETLSFDATQASSLAEVLDLAVGPDRRIYALDVFDARVLVFNANGSFARGIGRRGKGPGEFERPATLGWVNDTLWVSDPRLRRLTYLSRDGGLVGTERVSSEGRRGYPPTVPSARLVNGAFVTQVSAGSEQMRGPRRLAAVPLLLTRPDASAPDTLAWIELRSRYAIIQSDQFFQLSTFQPFDDSPLWAASSNGTALVVVERKVDDHHSGDASFEVTMLKPDGAIAYQRRYDVEPRLIDSGRVDSLVEAIGLRLAGSASWRAGRRSANEAVREALRLPDYWPSVTGIVLGRDGRTYLRGPGFWEEIAEWTVLGPLGDVEAFFRVPERYRLFEANAEYVWGVQYDALDVPTIKRTTLTPGQ